MSIILINTILPLSALMCNSKIKPHSKGVLVIILKMHIHININHNISIEQGLRNDCMILLKVLGNVLFITLYAVLITSW